MFSICLSSAAAILLIGHLFLPVMQSWLFSCIAACPWMFAAGAVETYLLITLKSDSVKIARVLHAALVVLAVGLGLWLAGLFAISAPVDLTATNVLLPDSRLAVSGQLLCELAVTFLLLNGLAKTLNYQRKTVPNPNRQRISGHIAELRQELALVNRQVDTVMTQLANPTGNLREWNNSRAAFIQEGVCIIHLRAPAEALLAEKQKLLARFTSNLN